MRTECTARELSSVRGGARSGKGSHRGGDVCVRVAGSLCSTAETGTAV